MWPYFAFAKSSPRKSFGFFLQIAAVRKTSKFEEEIREEQEEKKKEEEEKKRRQQAFKDRAALFSNGTKATPAAPATKA